MATPNPRRKLSADVHRALFTADRAIDHRVQALLKIQRLIRRGFPPTSKPSKPELSDGEADAMTRVWHDL